MADPAIFLDVNVPMYAAGAPHLYKPACVWVLTEIAAGRMSAVIDAEIVQEVLYRYGAMQQWQIAAQLATNLLGLVPLVLPVTVDDARLAVTFLTTYGPQGFKARDAIHAAVMQNHAIQRIVSTDKHFDLLPGIKRLDPLELFYAANPPPAADN